MHVTRAVIAGLLTLLFVTAYFGIYRVAAGFAWKRPRLRWSSMKQHIGRQDPSRRLLAALVIRASRRETWEELGQLLRGAGIGLNPLWYAVLKRGCVLLLLGTCALLWFGGGLLHPFLPAAPRLLAVGAGMMAVLLLFDRHMWISLRTYRSQRIVEEIYALSNHLLYFTGSRMNLHGKLTRCLPYTRLVRSEWHALLNEWYRNPEEAISGFRRKVGTDEAYAFAETLQALRLYDGEAYYDLLRQRVADFKEKLEMVRDSRKESLSYVLFLLAGIPIMYTFQLFIYPWVEEGRQLFENLQ